MQQRFQELQGCLKENLTARNCVVRLLKDVTVLLNRAPKRRSVISSATTASKNSKRKLLAASAGSSSGAVGSAVAAESKQRQAKRLKNLSRKRRKRRKAKTIELEPAVAPILKPVYSWQLPRGGNSDEYLSSLLNKV